MDWETWTLFALVDIGLSLTPGPAVLLVVSQGLARGGPASVWSNLGILAGNLVYFAISATGLGAILRGSYDLFFAIKWLGAAYLLWLGISAWIGKSKAFKARPAEGPPVSGPRMLLHGLVLQVANPKALVFFAALLPQFIDPAKPLALQFLILAATSVFFEFWALFGYGMLAGRIAAFAGRPAYAAILDRAAGTLLILAAVLIALMRKG